MVMIIFEIMCINLKIFLEKVCPACIRVMQLKREAIPGLLQTHTSQSSGCLGFLWQLCCCCRSHVSSNCICMEGPPRCSEVGSGRWGEALRLRALDHGDGSQGIRQCSALVLFPRAMLLGLGNRGSMRHGGNKVVGVLSALIYESLQY